MDSEADDEDPDTDAGDMPPRLPTINTAVSGVGSGGGAAAAATATSAAGSATTFFPGMSLPRSQNLGDQVCIF